MSYRLAAFVECLPDDDAFHAQVGGNSLVVHWRQGEQEAVAKWRAVSEQARGKVCRAGHAVSQESEPDPVEVRRFGETGGAQPGGLGAQLRRATSARGGGAIEIVRYHTFCQTGATPQ